MNDGGRGCVRVCSYRVDCNGFMNGFPRDTEMCERTIFQTKNCCDKHYTCVPVSLVSLQMYVCTYVDGVYYIALNGLNPITVSHPDDYRPVINRADLSGLPAS